MRIKQKIKEKVMGGVSIALAFMIGIAPIGVSAKTTGEEVIDIPIEVLEQLGITPAVTDTGHSDDIPADTPGDETVIDTGDTTVETVENIPVDETTDETTKETGDTAEGKYFTYGYNFADCYKVYIQPSYDVANWFGDVSWVYYTVTKNAERVSKDINQ